MVLSLLRQESSHSRSERLIRPALKKGNGFYLVKLPVQWTVQIANPEAIRIVLMKTGELLYHGQYFPIDTEIIYQDKFPKHLDILHTLGTQSPFPRLLGYKNIAVVNGEEWKQQRKLMSPVFHRSMPVQLFGDLMTKVFRNIDGGNGTVAVPGLMKSLALDIVGLSAFGFDFGALDGDKSEWLSTYELIREGFRTPLPWLFPKLDKYVHLFSPKRRKIIEAVDKLNGLLYKMAEQKREELKQNKALQEKEEHEKDLLTLLLEAEKREEGEVTDEFLKSNLAIFFITAQGGMATSLSLCIYHLALHKDIQRKAREEAFTILGDEPVDVFPSIQQCRQMRYIDMIIKENLRVTGSTALLAPRKATEDVMVGDTLIPKGTLISVDVYNTHHSPDIWEDSDEFIPERFAEGGEYESQSNKGLSWIPFSQGGRICIAVNFSLMQQRVSLAMLLRKYEWDLPEDSMFKDGMKVDYFRAIAPKSLKINFKKRY